MKTSIFVRLVSIISMCGFSSSCYSSVWCGEDSLRRGRNEAVIYSVVSRQAKLEGYQINVYRIENGEPIGEVVARKFVMAKLPSISSEDYAPGERCLGGIEKFDNKKVTYKYRTGNGWIKETWEWRK